MDTSSGRRRRRLLLRWGPTVATVAAVVSVLATVAAVLLHQQVQGLPTVRRLYIGDVVLGTAYPLVGAALVRRKPDNPVGWVLTSTALIGLFSLGGQYLLVSELVAPAPLPLAALGGWLNSWAWIPYLPLLTLLPLWFPDGRPPGPRWRLVVRASGVAIAVTLLARMLGPAPLDASDELLNPWALPLPVAAAHVGTMAGVVTVFLVLAPLSAVGLLQRIRRTRGPERAQAQWLLAGGVTLLLSFLAQTWAPASADDTFATAGLVAVLAAVLVGMLRHRLFDIDLVLNRTLVYLVLSGLVLGAYVGAVALVGRLQVSDRAGVATVAFAALLAASLRQGIQRLVDRLLYGARDPYTVVVRVGGRLDLARGPQEALASLVDELRDALRLPYVALRPLIGELAPLASGDPVERVEVLPVPAQGEQLAELVVGHRRGSRRFTAEERGLLEDVARRAAALVGAARLVVDLQRSRERIVLAREEERRRLRHDLHDGLGPQLAGMALQLDSLAERLAGDADLAGRVARLQTHMRGTVAEVRRVVDDLRPHALDELGLERALREHLEVFADAGVAVEVGTGGALPDLPAAVEVAAYRIVVEAVTNAVRHARPATCTVRLDAGGDALTIEVVDDGTGFAAPLGGGGVGLRSMQDRAEELGGDLEILAPAGGGTVVRARLPLATG